MQSAISDSEALIQQRFQVLQAEINSNCRNVSATEGEIFLFPVTLKNNNFFFISFLFVVFFAERIATLFFYQQWSLLPVLFCSFLSSVSPLLPHWVINPPRCQRSIFLPFLFFYQLLFLSPHSVFYHPMVVRLFIFSIPITIKQILQVVVSMWSLINANSVWVESRRPADLY